MGASRISSILIIARRRRTPGDGATTGSLLSFVLKRLLASRDERLSADPVLEEDDVDAALALSTVAAGAARESADRQRDDGRKNYRRASADGGWRMN